jgi:hypothetical protein
VPKAGTVEDDNPMGFCGQVDQAAGVKIRNHAAIAMQKDNRIAGPPLQIVHTDAANLQEPPTGWIIPRSFLGEMAVDQRRDGQ